MLETEIFKKCYPDFHKLILYGFVFDTDHYIYTKKIEEESFSIEIRVFLNGDVFGKVFDLELEDEYISFRIEDNIGEFAGKIRSQFEELLLDIREKCFYMQQFISNQSNRISKRIKEIYGDSPFFEWDSIPNFGVFKNKQTKKWYALIMNLDRGKLSAGNGEFDIINLKLDRKKIEKLLKNDGFYPAYHMNKKYWISISLDDTLDDNTILSFIDESYHYAEGSRVEKAEKEWIIPANPKYYDIDEGFRKHKTLTWKQSSDIQVGDIVYIYVGSPVSAIRYKCLVKKNNIPYSYEDKNVKMKYIMEIELLEEYDRGFCPFSKLKEYQVNAVRGPRFMPKNLSEYINQGR